MNHQAFTLRRRPDFLKAKQFLGRVALGGVFSSPLDFHGSCLVGGLKGFLVLSRIPWGDDPI